MTSYTRGNADRRISNSILPSLAHSINAILLIITIVTALNIGPPTKFVVASHRIRHNNNNNNNEASESEPEFDTVDQIDSSIPMASASSSNIQCEPITIKLCSQMAYQSTRMPNFFKDENQIEAVDRAKQYQDLVSSRCSPHIHAYICELLTPVCLEDSREAMKRFEIYPCRSFCRRVKRDCELELFKLNEQIYKQGGTSLLPGFACDQLPFESNGGNGTLRGPCHETPEPTATTTIQQQQQANKSSYSPYQPSFDTNIPPFITDTSRIDQSILINNNDNNNQQANLPTDNRFLMNSGTPIASWPLDNQNQQTILDPNSNMNKPLKPSQTDQQQIVDNNKPSNSNKAQTATTTSFFAQIQSFGQSVLWTLIRYSNVLSIATVLCLLAALNSKRLRRLKTYLNFSPSSSIKSSSSSTSGHPHPHHHHAHHHHHLDGNGKIMSAYGGSGGIHHHHQHHHKNSLSPSSSSRSLMLIAGSNKQPPTHQLLPADQLTDPSQKLLLNGLQKTLINVNGTLERQQQQQHQLNNRYLMMQPSGQPTPISGAPFKQHSDKQQLFNTLDSHSSSNQYDYIQVTTASDQASSGPMMTDHMSNGSFANCSPLTRHQQTTRHIYSNILLTSPSHQVLLMGEQGNNRQMQQQQQNGPRSQPPQHQPPGVGPRHAPYFSASLNPSYADPSGFLGSGSLIGDSPHSQRSFQRRASRKASGGQRYPLAAADIHLQQQARSQLKEFTRATSNTGGYTSAASSGSSSSSSAISPPTSAGDPQQTTTATHPPPLILDGGKSGNASSQRRI